MRTLLISLAACGAGILAVHLAAVSNIKSLALEESGSHLFSRVGKAADRAGETLAADAEGVRRLAASKAVKALLERGAPAGKRAALAAEAGKVPGLAAAALLRRDGSLAALYAADPGDAAFPKSDDGEVCETGLYFSPPEVRAGRYSYEISAAVNGASPGGILRARFKSRRLPLSGKDAGERLTAYLFKREGGVLRGALQYGKKELPVSSPEAALFNYAIQGKEGYNHLLLEKERQVFAHALVPGADWVLAASQPYSPAEIAGAASALRKQARQALLAFAALALAVFTAVKLLPCPLSDTARQAAALLAEFGIKPGRPEEGCEDLTVINSALTESYSLLRKKDEAGQELEREAEQLREEEEDLKYQNVQLDKINQYLLEREARIAELKKELRELQLKVEQEKK